MIDPCAVTQGPVACAGMYHGHTSQRSPDATHFIGAMGHELKTETEWETTTQFVLGTRAYSAHIRSHVNATASHPIVHSYTNASNLFAQIRAAVLEIIPEVIAENRRWSASAPESGYP